LTLFLSPSTAIGAAPKGVPPHPISWPIPFGEVITMEKENLEIEPITLEWTDWVWWDKVKNDTRNRDLEIPKEPGVYEVKGDNAEKRLTIGRTTSLRRRIRHGLVIGTGRHSAGKRIRDSENTAKLLIRWAVTRRPAAAEEELHRRHEKRFGGLPEYVKHT
jgi:hypothetical protein